MSHLSRISCRISAARRIVGNPRRTRIIAPLLTLLTGRMLCGCAPSHSPQSEPAKDGRTLYAAYCLSCHGPTGRNDRSGALPAMRLSEANGLPAPAWNALVANGRGAMPAFHGRLSSSQADALRVYIHQLTTP